MKIILPSSTAPLRRLSRMLKGKAYSEARFFIILDENTYQHCLAPLVAQVEPLQMSELIEVPAGEACKEPAIAAQVWESLCESGADRHSVIVNLGGGCVSDLGGFVAAAFKRGVRHINIPTTLVGMADAAIGGKTALNIGGFKNQTGFFHQPDIVCIDPEFLQTLPPDELTDGVFEMLKTFLIAGSDLYGPLCDSMLGGDPTLPPDMIAACAEIKTAVVKADPYDLGTRHILNFGHTFGHAIEAFSLQQGTPLSHGRAVGIGMAAALALSVGKLGLNAAIAERYREVAARLTPMPHYSLADSEIILRFMRQDKKNAAGEIRCVLLKEPGAPVIDLAIDENEIRQALLRL